MAKEKKGMNLPNKITCARLVIAVAVLVILCVPWQNIGVEWPHPDLLGVQDVNIKYIVAGVLFLVGSLTDFLDGYIARKYNLVTDFGKVMDAIADKVLVNGVLILFACGDGDIRLHVIVPVIIITRDIVVDSIKMASGSKGKVVAASWPGKIKTVCMMIGLTLLFFYDFPFVLIGNGIPVGEFFVYVATIMSIISGCQYWLANKDFIFSEV